MSKYFVYIKVYEDPNEILAGTTKVVDANNLDEALGYLDPEVNRVWVTLKQSAYATVETPSINTDIETK